MSRESEEQVNFGDLVSGFSFDSARIRKRGKKPRKRKRRDVELEVMPHISDAPR